MPDYNPLYHVDENLVELLKLQNDSGAEFGKFGGWEPNPVIVAKILFNLAATTGITGEVFSVNGMTGNVVLNKGHIGLGNVPNVDVTNANNLTSGTIPAARFPANLPAIGGESITTLNASSLSIGTVPVARLPAFTGGDVTGSAGSGVLTISGDSVTYAKMQNVSAASRLIGRGSAGGAGDPEEIMLGSGLTLIGTTLSASGAGGGVDYNASSNSSGNTTISVASGKGVHTEITAISGSGSTTRIFILSTSGTPEEGAIIKHRVSMPTTAAILVEWRDATSGGTLLTSYLSDDSGDDLFVEFVFNGTAWTFLNFIAPANAN